LPSVSVKPTEIDGKILVEEHPALTGLCRFDEPAPRAFAQHSGRHAQEGRRLPQIKGLHGSVLIASAPQRHVVAARLHARLGREIGITQISIPLAISAISPGSRRPWKTRGQHARAQSNACNK
jgi:hypothetical protein